MRVAAGEQSEEGFVVFQHSLSLDVLFCRHDQVCDRSFGIRVLLWTTRLLTRSDELHCTYTGHITLANVVVEMRCKTTRRRMRTLRRAEQGAALRPLYSMTFAEMSNSPDLDGLGLCRLRFDMPGHDVSPSGLFVCEV